MKDIGSYKMNLNEPNVVKKRSYIPGLSHSSHFTMNAGELIPMDRAWAILPGDTWKLKQSTLIRMTNPPKTPTMDQLVVDYYYFYTPYRVLDGTFDKVITGDTGTQWNLFSNSTVSYFLLSKPTISSGTPSAVTINIANSIYQYLHMLPGSFKTYNSTTPNSPAGYVQAYPVMNYYRIWNDYFRIKYLQSEINNTYTATGNQVANINLGVLQAALAGYRTTYGVGLANPPSITNGIPCAVNRLDDYFSTALPFPSKGGETLLDLSLPLNGFTNNYLSTGIEGVTMSYLSSNSTVNLTNQNNMYDSAVGAYSHPLSDGSNNTLYGFTNLKGGSIASLRQAFAIDAVKTLDARYGTYIVDYEYAHFGVILPDYRAPRPEYLGKRRFYFNINQVIQSSETGVTPQGTAGAWGQSVDPQQFIFSKSFTEFGIIQGVMCVRVLNHTYAQGMDRQFQKFHRMDFYLPQMANISDLPIYKLELYTDLSAYNQSGVNNLNAWIQKFSNDVFGYAEAWSEYKFMPNSAAGLLDPSVTGNLAHWTYADYYASVPTLTSSWLTEPYQNIDNTLMYPSSTAPNFVVDCYFEIDAYRIMPLHNMPGGLTGAW